MGGCIVQEAAIARPERVISLTINCSFAKLDRYGNRICENLIHVYKTQGAREAARHMTLFCYTPAYFNSHKEEIDTKEKTLGDAERPAHAFRRVLQLFLQPAAERVVVDAIGARLRQHVEQWIDGSLDRTLACLLGAAVLLDSYCFAHDVLAKVRRASCHETASLAGANPSVTLYSAGFPWTIASISEPPSCSPFRPCSGQAMRWWGGSSTRWCHPSR